MADEAPRTYEEEEEEEEEEGGGGAAAAVAAAATAGTAAAGTTAPAERGEVEAEDEVEEASTLTDGPPRVDVLSSSGGDTATLPAAQHAVSSEYL